MRRMEQLTGTPSFLTLGAWQVCDRTFEIAGRRKLDSRLVLPYFRAPDGTLVAGLLERERPARELRGAPRAGLEAIGFDFAGVDQTGDIRAYGRALFTARTHVKPADTQLQIALPSWARSIGYLTELALPLLLAIEPPATRDIAVAWDGGDHRLIFRPVAELVALASDPARPCGEEVLALLHALAPDRAPHVPAFGPADFRPRGADVFTAERLAASLAEATPDPARRLAAPRAEDLRFLRAHRQREAGTWFELVTPGTGISVAMLPYLRAADGNTYALLWHEARPAALERRAHRPLFDLPVPLRYANAIAFFVAPDERAALGRDPRAVLEALLGRVLPRVRVRGQVELGAPGEPDISLSSELRYRFACELDGASLPALPEGAFLVELGELARAVGDGLVRDPVVTGGLLALGLDPFARARTGDPARRRAYLDRMTEGSQVQARLQTYSSIEAEQLESPTYARVMTLLQHEFGLRIVYPQADTDRAFFKAAYRVFMAADRGSGERDRALQGLHFSHDCFHFVLGNFTPPAMPDFARWYASGEPPPAEQPPEGPAWEAFARALKHAEDEATFFSFFTLYAEHLPLARHVGQLTFFEAMRDLGFHDRATVWPLYVELVDEARIPPAIAQHPRYAQRADIAALMEYMRGFRDYQLGDIRTAWKYAVRDPYRAYAIRLGIYETDLARYLAHVSTFCARLAKVELGLDPVLAACADVRVELALRVWDVMKGLKLARDAAPVEGRQQLLAGAEEVMRALEECKADLAGVRARVRDAELSARNEAIVDEIAVLAARVERIRAGWWDALAATGYVPAATIAEERVRALPR